MDENIIIPPGVGLEVVDGAEKGSIFTINNKTITIGRDDKCDFVLTDPHVSKKHCQIVYRGDHFTVIDLQSLNKTRVNDNDYQQRNLFNGDIITIGLTRIKFTWAGQPDAGGSASNAGKEQP